MSGDEDKRRRKIGDREENKERDSILSKENPHEETEPITSVKHHKKANIKREGHSTSKSPANSPKEQSPEKEPFDDDLEYDESYDSDELKSRVGEDEDFFEKIGKSSFRSPFSSFRKSPSPSNSPSHSPNQSPSSHPKSSSSKSSPRQSPSSFFGLPSLAFHLELSPREAVARSTSEKVNEEQSRREASLAKKMSTPDILGSGGESERKRKKGEREKKKKADDAITKSPSIDSSLSLQKTPKYHKIPSLSLLGLAHRDSVHPQPPSSSSSSSSSSVSSSKRLDFSGDDAEISPADRRAAAAAECAASSPLQISSSCGRNERKNGLSDSESDPPSSPSVSFEPSSSFPIDAIDHFSLSLSHSDNTTPPFPPADTCASSSSSSPSASSSSSSSKSPVKRLPIHRPRGDSHAADDSKEAIVRFVPRRVLNDLRMRGRSVCACMCVCVCVCVCVCLVFAFTWEWREVQMEIVRGRSEESVY